MCHIECEHREDSIQFTVIVSCTLQSALCILLEDQKRNRSLESR